MQLFLNLVKKKEKYVYIKKPITIKKQRPLDTNHHDTEKIIFKYIVS